MKFPVHVKHRKAEATIYGKTESYGLYRVAHYANGNRILRSFASYAAAKEAAESTVRDLAKGSAVSTLTASQSLDALAAFGRLDGHFTPPRKRPSLNAVVGEYLEALSGLPPKSTLLEAIRSFRENTASVTRKSLAEAVEEFNTSREAKTVAVDGKRPQLNPVYVADTSRMLREFSDANTAIVVCEVTKEHVDLYLSSRSELSVKSRNHHRATLLMFLRWCQRRDYLAGNSRLLGADGLRREEADSGDVEFYSAAELRRMLAKGKSELALIIALQAFGGLRLQESLRLDWRDVWSIAGHIQVSAAKAKTRSRRLCEINPTLAAWLEPHRGKSGKSGPVTSHTLHGFTWQLIQLRKRLKIPSKRNGLRHGFLSAHFAIHQNESATAAQSGTSPQMLFKHYRGLMPKQEAERWFAVKPKRLTKSRRSTKRLQPCPAKTASNIVKLKGVAS